MVSHWLSSDEFQVTSDWPSSGIGLTLKWYWIDSQLVSHWLSSDEIQVTSDWPSSGIGLTGKWFHIGSLVMEFKWHLIG